MIRTPLVRRIKTVEELNTVACYLPEYDATTVESVIEKLKEDNIAVDSKNIIKNPADVGWFGIAKKRIEKRLDQKQKQKKTAEKASPAYPIVEKTTETSGPDAAYDTSAYATENPTEPVAGSEFDVNVSNDDFPVDLDDEDTETEQELTEALERIPKVDEEAIRKSFEGIITRCVRHEKPNHFLDLWDCVDIIMADLDKDSDLEHKLQEEFYNNVEGDIAKHPAEFKRSYVDIRNTKVSVKRVDPLTGEEFQDREELVENDADRLVANYRKVVNVFAGASDLIKYYINRRMSDALANDVEAIGRICAVGMCYEIVEALEVWAENKTQELLDIYGPQRYAVSEENKEKWDRIEGNTKPYIERNLSIKASITRQNKDYDAYPKHIISDENGFAYLNLKDLEKKVVRTELSHSLNVAWYRNQPRNLNASLAIPYQIGDNLENMYPDFIFFKKTGDGRIIRTIVDPHGDWLGDSVAKLKGYVAYLRAHPDMFGSVQAVTDEKGGVCRYLDLMDKNTQDAIEKFTGSSAKELFTGPQSRMYYITL